jgi:hypothetical protein
MRRNPKEVAAAVVLHPLLHLVHISMDVPQERTFDLFSTLVQRLRLHKNIVFATIAFLPYCPAQRFVRSKRFKPSKTGTGDDKTET